MRALAVLVCALAQAGLASGDPLPQQANRVVDYRISVTLDPQSRQLKATERVTWRNPSAEAVPDLWFHLYLNAFKNTKSTFYKESGGQLRGDQAQTDSWGWVDITSMKTADGADLTKAMTFEHPDDNNADDQTVIRVVLPEPVPAGGSITLDIAFTAKLPQVFARTGFKDDFYLVGQWYPKLGVYEPAGMRGRASGGWNCHQFHASSEFYADFGTFTVDMTVPSDYVLGATGIRTAEKRNADGTTTYTHEQADVHDFAWTADPDFLVVKGTFSATKDVTQAEYQKVARLLGRTMDEVMLTDVDIIALVQPGHTPQAQRHIDSAKAAIKWYGLWYGRYPFKTLTVVDPAPGASGAGGMEYPTFITAGTSFVMNRWPFDKIRALEMVTIHEFGHNFWYGLVGSNEFEEAWLDEGINSYSTGEVMDQVYGADRGMVEFLGLRIGEADILRAINSPDAKYNRILANAWDYVPQSQYGFYSYQKPEMVLRTLKGYLGEETMARILRTYHERWRFRHPGSDDFFAVVNEVSGQDLSPFFAQVVRGTDMLDYDIGSAVVRPVPEPHGVFDTPTGRRTISQSEARRKNAELAKAKKQLWETIVVVRRRGEAQIPIDVDFKFAGKPVERYTWDGRDRTKTFRFVLPEKLEWVEVDRDRKIALDANWLNNGRRMEPDTRVTTTWASRWMFVAQNVLFWLGL
ncbi:MAG: M1 family metallopeptidase [Vicinamibacterales bacterium]|nr:M1 family metallopeptidase [Vicinamibacterales bacterium]